MCKNVLLVMSAVVLATACQAQPSPQKEEREKQCGWSSFDKGSWIIVEETRKRGADSKSKREKSLVSGFDATHVLVAKMPEVDGKFVEEGIAHMPHRFTLKANKFEEGKLRKEVVEIAGKKIDCAVQEFTITNQKPAYTAKIVFWHDPTVKIPYHEIPQDVNVAVPSDAVKVQLTFEDDQKRSKNYTGKVEDFAKKLKVDKQDLTCVVLKWDLEDIDPKSGKSSMEARVWLAAEVPGCEVKIEAKGEFMGKTVLFDRTVVDYHAIKREQ
jgi:hypothetical protein